MARVSASDRAAGYSELPGSRIRTPSGEAISYYRYLKEHGENPNQYGDKGLKGNDKKLYAEYKQKWGTARGKGDRPSARDALTELKNAGPPEKRRLSNGRLYSVSSPRRMRAIYWFRGSDDWETFVEDFGDS